LFPRVPFTGSVVSICRLYRGWSTSRAYIMDKSFSRTAKMQRETRVYKKKSIFKLMNSKSVCLEHSMLIRCV